MAERKKAIKDTERKKKAKKKWSRTAASASPKRDRSDLQPNEFGSRTRRGNLSGEAASKHWNAGSPGKPVQVGLLDWLFNLIFGRLPRSCVPSPRLRERTGRLAIQLVVLRTHSEPARRPTRRCCRRLRLKWTIHQALKSRCTKMSPGNVIRFYPTFFYSE